ncbi:putative XPG/Rad2 endonuclease, PIN-like domain superfamily [Helianthus annuus]|nr:putative XPG/Rad2 endonuclease, PIN-like domain superfamily [Helianthus annuus]KAJ0608308.1 putative XPG/Rad2 endonuclease, PIN-like domain superfamily [Helianthus annuus]KAJ0768374.1 putative XPG/Rad2 endonuclease, PIN-like domain superfamily [Helianthus annuus]
MENIQMSQWISLIKGAKDNNSSDRELLELFGMSVLKASGQTKAFCAQSNKEGHVDACITYDRDVF